MLLDALGRQTYQLANLQLSATAQPDAACNNFALKLTHNASHTQAWSPSPCSHTIPSDRASEFILRKLGDVSVSICTPNRRCLHPTSICGRYLPQHEI